MLFKFRKLKSFLNFKAMALLAFFILFFKIFIDESNSLSRANMEYENVSSHKIQDCFLVVLILTGPKNYDERKVIRETWLSDDSSSSDVCHYFSIGTEGLPKSEFDSLMVEQKLYKDLLVLKNFRDAYEKLTEKLALSLDWLNDNVGFQYVLKADDDTFARVDVILSELKAHPSDDYLYWGFFYGKGTVKRSGQWKETNWKLCDHYLPYARGGGYVLSHKLVKFIAKNWLDFELYLSEDVTVGSWLAPLKLNRRHDVRFDTEYKSRGCKNEFVVTHKQSIEDMTTKHKNLRTLGKMCKVEVVNFHGYKYDWDAVPSKCCVRSDKFP